MLMFLTELVNVLVPLLNAIAGIAFVAILFIVHALPRLSSTHHAREVKLIKAKRK